MIFFIELGKPSGDDITTGYKNFLQKIEGVSIINQAFYPYKTIGITIKTIKHMEEFLKKIKKLDDIIVLTIIAKKKYYYVYSKFCDLQYKNIKNILKDNNKKKIYFTFDV